MVSYDKAKPLTRQEEQSLRDALARGEAPRCPRCHHLLDTMRVPPRQDVSYVRRRIVLLCPQCKLRAALDSR